MGINVVESTRIFPSLGRWLISTKTSCWRRRRQESELFSEGVFSMLISTPAQNRSRIIPVPAIQLSLRIIFLKEKRKEELSVISRLLSSILCKQTYNHVYHYNSERISLSISPRSSRSTSSKSISPISFSISIHQHLESTSLPLISSKS